MQSMSLILEEETWCELSTFTCSCVLQNIMIMFLFRHSRFNLLLKLRNAANLIQVAFLNLTHGVDASHESARK